MYKISCHDCDATYVRQTKYQLKAKVYEHISDIKNTSGSPSIILNHHLTTKQWFELERRSDSR